MLACFGSFIPINAVQSSTGFGQGQWPQRFVIQEGTLSVFQPQLDSYKGEKITGRAAISIEKKEALDPVFGLVWFSARAVTGQAAGMVEFKDIQVERAKFPHVTLEQEKQWTDLLRKESGKWVPPRMAYNRLLAVTAAAEREKTEAARLNMEPPRIIFTTTPSALILINGKPEFRKVENSTFQRVINSPFLILFDPSDNTYYTRGGDFWYSATNVMGPWKNLTAPPASVVEVASRIMEPVERPGKDQPAPDVPPSILVATEPTELIVSDGQPRYAAVQGTQLLYMSNTPSEVFMEVRSQKYYVLLAGRWYESRSLEKGPWSYVASENLPDDFKRIPPGSLKGHILAFVAGTVEAEEAVLDAQIPQTKAIKRSEAKLSVSYDGDPTFERIQNTDMQYAVNTKTQVIRVKDRYYALDQAVWFVSDNPKGPWSVADAVPPEIETIPPESPVYNAKYVRVYDSTPDEVYVGYTPGYFGSYVNGDTIVYGTGYSYPGWVGSVYYPAPFTWGFAPIYDPFYYSWGFGWGFGAGFVSASFWGFPVGVAISPWWYGCHWAGWYPGYGYRYGYGYPSYGYKYGYPWRYGYGYPRHRWYAGHRGHPHQGYRGGAYRYPRAYAGISRPINIRQPVQGMARGPGRTGPNSNAFRQGQTNMDRTGPDSNVFRPGQGNINRTGPGSNAFRQGRSPVDRPGQGTGRPGQTESRTWGGGSSRHNSDQIRGGGSRGFNRAPGAVSGRGSTGQGWTGGGHRSYGQAPAWGGGVRNAPGFGSGGATSGGFRRGSPGGSFNGSSGFRGGGGFRGGSSGGGSRGGGGFHGGGGSRGGGGSHGGGRR